MDKQPVFLSIANQKGGVGKSTCTIFLASLLHYRAGYRVLVVDCDYPQHSIARQRERDLNVMDQNKRLKSLMLRQYELSGQKIFPVLSTTPEKASGDVAAFLRHENYIADLVLFDLPGTIGTKGVLSLLAHLDYVLIPMKADRAVMESSITFARTLNEGIIRPGRGRLRGVGMFWTMIDRRERTLLYEQYEKVLKQFGLKALHSRLPVRSRFSRESDTSGAVYRSTLYPADKSFASESGLEELLSEICTLIQLQ